LSSFLKYKGYLGSVEYSEEDNLLCGEVVGINDLIMYHGDSLESLRADFEEAITHYLEVCEGGGLEPDKTTYEDIDIQISPELRRSLIVFSLERKVPLRETVNEAIRNYITA